MLSQVDGYYKNPSVMIPFPPDVKKVEDKLRQLGLGNQVDRFVMTLNRGAEDAAAQAKPIFVNAVRAMTIEDAWAIHEHSNRKENPYVILDCSVLPPSLAHRELFGHTRGSFTGAHENSRGILAKAENGTLFMDEIGELPLEMQPIFLRVLEQREFTPLGSTVSEKMSARIIAATNRNLLQDVNNQRFRADLFYRLSILHFEIPPLRERSEDIPLLANHFLKEFNASSVQAVSEMDLQNLLEPHLESLKSHPWPGNVRELRNTMERLYLKSLNVDPHQLSISLENPPKDDGLEMMCRRLVTSGASFRDAKQQTIDYFEYLYLKNLLRESNDNVSEAARRCDVDRRNFQKLIRKYGL
jgi:two-component system response regulator AtoC